MRSAWALALGLLLAAFFAYPVLGARDFTVDANPSSFEGGQFTTVVLTVTNTTDSDRHDVINCVQFLVDDAFDVSSVSIESVYGATGVAYAQWVAVWPWIPSGDLQRPRLVLLR